MKFFYEGLYSINSSFLLSHCIVAMFFLHMRRFLQFGNNCTIKKKRENTHGGVLLSVKF